MGDRSVSPRWLFLLVVAATIAGIAFAFWFYAFLSGPPIPQ
jgi:hypothetical protein